MELHYPKFKLIQWRIRPLMFCFKASGVKSQPHFSQWQNSHQLKWSQDLTLGPVPVLYLRECALYIQLSYFLAQSSSFAIQNNL